MRGCLCRSQLSAHAGDTVRGEVSLRIQQIDVRCETKTKDNVFINVVVCATFYRNPGAIWHLFWSEICANGRHVLP